MVQRVEKWIIDQIIVTRSTLGRFMWDLLLMSYKVKLESLEYMELNYGINAIAFW